MLGGYNVQSLVALLKTDKADLAAKALSKITLIFDAFYDVQKLYENGNSYADSLLNLGLKLNGFLLEKLFRIKLESLFLKQMAKQILMIYHQHKMRGQGQIFLFMLNQCSSIKYQIYLK